MSTLETVIIQGNAQRLLQLYTSLFKDRFGADPILDVNECMEVLRWLIQKVGAEKAEQLLTVFFSLNDEWVINRAFPLQWLQKNINQVIAASVTVDKANRPLYVVGYTTSGVEVLSTNIKALDGCPGALTNPQLFKGQVDKNN